MRYRSLGHYVQRSKKHLLSGFNRYLSTNSRKTNFPPHLLQIHPAVRQALSENKPVVALESTIIAQGIPYPENLKLCRRITAILRERGVEPATVAIRDGVCRVGLTMDEIEDLSISNQEGRAEKVSTRDIALTVARHNENLGISRGPQWGATTVASTMTFAHAAGISTFVTGGIGGVHRNGELSMDVSADLSELARTPVVVVSAGIKSILDISKTLEVLETNGVPVVAYQADEFPAFFSPNSGVQAPTRVDDPNVIASAYWTARNLGLSHGMLVAVPNSDPAGANVEKAIQEALQEADKLGISGKLVTPFILQRVAEKTEGDSVRSNLALVEQNALVGAEIAIAIAEGRSRAKQDDDDSILFSVPVTAHSSRVIVMGGAVVDIVAKPASGKDLILHTSNPAICTESDGGVGRNIAETLGKLGAKPLFYSAVGKDPRGTSIIERLKTNCGVVHTAETVTQVENMHTATYVAVLEGHGDLHTACADTTVLSKIRPPPEHVLAKAEILVMDSNPPVHELHTAAISAKRLGVKVLFEPTSVSKAIEVCRDDMFMESLTYATPNIDELSAMSDGWTSTEDDMDDFQHDNSHRLIDQIAEDVIKRMNPDEAHLIVTLGSKGVLLASRYGTSEPTFEHFSAHENVKIVNATGAGDSLCGAFVFALLNGLSLREAVIAGMKVAKMSLESDTAVPPILDPNTILIKI